MSIKLSTTNIEPWISPEELKNHFPAALRALESLHNKDGEGNDMLGWVSLPSEAAETSAELLKSCKKFSEKLECVVIIGIGGSYLGAKAVLEALNPHFGKLPGPEICFAGHQLSEDYLAELKEHLKDKNWGIVVISKSGKTTEPAIAFRILKSSLEQKFGKANARERVIAITDKSKGALRIMAEEEAYKTFIIPDDIGGRYSVLTPVGLVPIAIAGYDIDMLIKGAQEMMEQTDPGVSPGSNPAIIYAAARSALLKAGKTTEVLANFNPRIHYIAEWWKQLYGESEGKDHKGIFPASVDFTTDLHSMGQYIQDGPRNLFETFITIGDTGKELRVPEVKDDLDQLNYISGKRIEEINKQAALGTLLAHVDGGVPVISLQLEKLSEKELGALFYFFEIACGISGYMLEVNPFNQPGVEDYKNNMFALLGKPGFEEQTEALRKRLE